MSNNTKQTLISTVAALLSIVFVFSTTAGIFPSKTSGAKTNLRTIKIVNQAKSDLSCFDSYEINEDDACPEFNGIAPCSAVDASEYFDDVSLEECTDDVTLKFNCKFNMETLQYFLEIVALDAEGNVLDKEETVTDAFVTENGGLDAYIDVDGEQMLLSELAEGSELDDCGLLSKLIKKVVEVAVIVYVAVAETAEQIKAKSNLTYNEQLETDNNGVASGNYITRQTETSRAGYKSGKYKFGFTEFANVGCEVASAYNLLISLGKTQRLSKVINDFEKLGIELSIGWGNLGSNPCDINRILNKYDISFSKYTSYKNFKNALSNKSSCKVIMSAWNNGGMLKSIFSGEGLHTYFFKKNSASSFDTYNLNYSNTTVWYGSIDDIYAEGGDFIVAYIVS